MLRIGLVGDHQPDVTAHRAIPEALRLVSLELGETVTVEWLHTGTLADNPRLLDRCDGTWCVPASPYASTSAALDAIRSAREGRRPFLGTCGGFQHAVIEYARNVLGYASAAHAELDPAADDPVVSMLSCSLMEETGGVRFADGSRIGRAYGVPEAIEGYHCRYGLSRTWVERLDRAPLRVTAWDSDGDPRAIELDGHPFFVATLFQSERRALVGESPPLVRAFVQAVAAQRAATDTNTAAHESPVPRT